MRQLAGSGVKGNRVWGIEVGERGEYGEGKAKVLRAKCSVLGCGVWFDAPDWAIFGWQERLRCPKCGAGGVKLISCDPRKTARWRSS